MVTTKIAPLNHLQWRGSATRFLSILATTPTEQRVKNVWRPLSVRIATALDRRDGRGRPRPLFLGEAPKTKHSALFEQYFEEVASGGLGDALEAFRYCLLKIRCAGS